MNPSPVVQACRQRESVLPASPGERRAIQQQLRAANRERWISSRFPAEERLESDARFRQRASLQARALSFDARIRRSNAQTKKNGFRKSTRRSRLRHVTDLPLPLPVPQQHGRALPGHVVRKVLPRDVWLIRNRFRTAVFARRGFSNLGQLCDKRTPTPPMNPSILPSVSQPIALCEDLDSVVSSWVDVVKRTDETHDLAPPRHTALALPLISPRPGPQVVAAS